MTVEQLQKPNVAGKLITKFVLTPSVSDRAGSRVPAAGRRGRLSGGCSSTTRALDPQGMALTKADEVVVVSAGDDSILIYDVEGRLIRRIDQRQLLQRVEQGNDNDDDAGAAATADNPHKLVPRTSTSLSSYRLLICLMSRERILFKQQNINVHQNSSRYSHVSQQVKCF